MRYFISIMSQRISFIFGAVLKNSKIRPRSLEGHIMAFEQGKKKKEYEIV